MNLLRNGLSRGTIFSPEELSSWLRKNGTNTAETTPKCAQPVFNDLCTGSLALIQDTGVLSHREPLYLLVRRQDNEGSFPSSAEPDEQAPLHVHGCRTVVLSEVRDSSALVWESSGGLPPKSPTVKPLKTCFKFRTSRARSTRLRWAGWSGIWGISPNRLGMLTRTLRRLMRVGSGWHEREGMGFRCGSLFACPSGTYRKTKSGWWTEQLMMRSLAGTLVASSQCLSFPIFRIGVISTL
jgi:hypothetical protein